MDGKRAVNMAAPTPKSQKSFIKPPVLPANVRAGQVVGLVEITGGLGTNVDAAQLADELGADIAVLIPILDTAEMLGLVKIEKGEVSLTEFGLKFQKTAKSKVRLLKEQLGQIEPFRTALEVAAKKGRVTAQEVADELLEKGVKWHHDVELNESMVQTMLIHWAIYAGLLSYNGKTGKFEKV
jgi:hypothetical protein